MLVGPDLRAGRAQAGVVTGRPEVGPYLPLRRSLTCHGFALALLLAAALRAQTAPAAPAPAKPDDAAKDEAVVLSPFQATAESDQGYAARETLAGTRFKSELKDVPSQVSVMTKEFLDDIASVRSRTPTAIPRQSPLMTLVTGQNPALRRSGEARTLALPLPSKISED